MAINTNYRLIAEMYFNKKIGFDEVVHHIDGNRDNNGPENLVIMKNSQHAKMHGNIHSMLENWHEEKHAPKRMCNLCGFVSLYNQAIKEYNLDFFNDVANICCLVNMVIRADRCYDMESFKKRNWKIIYQLTYEGILMRNIEDNHSCNIV